jgi:hypothetical protein
MRAWRKFRGDDDIQNTGSRTFYGKTPHTANHRESGVDDLLFFDPPTEFLQRQNRPDAIQSDESLLNGIGRSANDDAMDVSPVSSAAQAALDLSARKDGSVSSSSTIVNVSHD